MPLTQRVDFQAALRRSNRVQIPKLICWQFKMDADQVLKVGVKVPNTFKGWQFFYSKMLKDGRITVPKIVLSNLGDDTANFLGRIVEVMIEPA